MRAHGISRGHLFPSVFLLLQLPNSGALQGVVVAALGWLTVLILSVMLQLEPLGKRAGLDAL